MLVIRTAGTIDAALMDHGKNLRVIGRHGVGYDQVDIPAATERGILVVYTPVNTQGVAEHVFAMMIGVSKCFPGQMKALIEGRYNERTKLVGRDIAGKTIRDAVRVAVYLMVNARLQTEAMRLGDVTFLSEGEMTGTAEMSASPLAMDRIWEYWTRRSGYSPNTTS